VVELVRAVREDSRVVELEVVGVNGNGDGLFDDGSGQGIGISLRNIGVAGDFESSSVGLAFLVSGNVFVGIFIGNTVLFNVLESLVHKSSVASLVSERGRAINQLLFRERLEFLFTEKGRGSFKSSDSGEGPAGSTLSLVFNRVNSSVFSPVDTGGEVIISNGEEGGNLGFLDVHQSLEHGGEFRSS